MNQSIPLPIKHTTSKRSRENEDTPGFGGEGFDVREKWETLRIVTDFDFPLQYPSMQDQIKPTNQKKKMVIKSGKIATGRSQKNPYQR